MRFQVNSLELAHELCDILAKYGYKAETGTNVETGITDVFYYEEGDNDGE